MDMEPIIFKFGSEMIEIFDFSFMLTVLVNRKKYLNYLQVAIYYQRSNSQQGNHFEKISE